MTGGQKAAITRTINSKKIKKEKRPGLREIKQVNLYEKWVPLVPLELRDEICPKPSDKIINSVKEETKTKRNIRKYK